MCPLYVDDIVRLRSERSREKAYVRFINCTERTVEVIWINFDGTYVSYQLLDKGRFVDVNTYTGHPWIAQDHRTRDRLQIEKEFIYFPKTTKQYFENRCPTRVLPEDFEARIRAIITLPLYSLRYTTLLMLRNYLKTPEEVDQLELPRELIDDLKKVVTQRNEQIVEPLIRIG